MDIIKVVQELEEIAGKSRGVPAMRGKIMVDQARLMAMVEQLSIAIPASILEAKEVLKQKDSMLSQVNMEVRRIKAEAIEEAEEIVSSAQEEHAVKVGDSEVLRTAQERSERMNQDSLQEAKEVIDDARRRAYRIIEEAEKIALERREGSDRYAQETLFDLEERLSVLLQQVRRGLDVLGAEEQPAAEEVESSSAVA